MSFCQFVLFVHSFVCLSMCSSIFVFSQNCGSQSPSTKEFLSDSADIAIAVIFVHLFCLFSCFVRTSESVQFLRFKFLRFICLCVHFFRLLLSSSTSGAPAVPPRSRSSLPLIASSSLSSSSSSSSSSSLSFLVFVFPCLCLSLLEMLPHLKREAVRKVL